MSLPQPVVPHCANCGVEIPWRPAIHRGKSYCCGGCAQGGPCYCSYDLGERDDPGSPISLRAFALDPDNALRKATYNEMRQP